MVSLDIPLATGGGPANRISRSLVTVFALFFDAFHCSPSGGLSGSAKYLQTFSQVSLVLHWQSNNCRTALVCLIFNSRLVFFSDFWSLTSLVFLRFSKVLEGLERSRRLVGTNSSYFRRNPT